MALTVRQIDALKPAEKVQTLADGRGLCLVIDTAGRKGWRFRYYRPNGKRNMMSLGPYPDISLAEARQKADEARALLLQGIDPGEQRKADKRSRLHAAGNSFAELAREWFDITRLRWKSTSTRAKTCWAAFEAHVFPYVGSRPIADIQPLEWLEVLRLLEKAEKYEQRDRVHGFCRDVYRFAIVTGRAKHNPLTDIGVALVPHKKKSFPHVSRKEIPDLLRAISSYSGSVLIKGGLKLLMHTAVRPGEMRGAQWSEFDLDSRLWVIPAERMKMGRAHRVHLSRQAVSILRELERLTGRYPLVFTGRNDKTKPLADAAFSRALERMGYKDRQVPHGMRHLVATELRELGYPRDWVEVQLSHKLPGVEGIYTHAEYTAPDQRPRMMQEWSDYLDRLELGDAAIEMTGMAELSVSEGATC